MHRLTGTATGLYDGSGRLSASIDPDQRNFSFRDSCTKVSTAADCRSACRLDDARHAGIDAVPGLTGPRPQVPLLRGLWVSIVTRRRKYVEEYLLELEPPTRIPYSSEAVCLPSLRA